jgi:hypothetical protein
VRVAANGIGVQADLAERYLALMRTSPPGAGGCASRPADMRFVQRAGP